MAIGLRFLHLHAHPSAFVCGLMMQKAITGKAKGGKKKKICRGAGGVLHLSSPDYPAARF